MSTILGYLVNNVTVSVSGQGSVSLQAGYSCTDSGVQAAIVSAGGVLANPNDVNIIAAVAIVKKMRKRGQNEDVLNRVMMAAFTAAVQLDDPPPRETAQAVSSTSLAETYVCTLAGNGTIIAAAYVPGANSAPASGSNSQAITLNIYNALGVLVGVLATGTVNNATQMTKWLQFALALTAANVAYGPGFFITAQTTLTGTATLPAGTWMITALPN